MLIRTFYKLYESHETRKTIVREPWIEEETGRGWGEKEREKTSFLKRILTIFEEFKRLKCAINNVQIEHINLNFVSFIGVALSSSSDSSFSRNVITGDEIWA